MGSYRIVQDSTGSWVIPQDRVGNRRPPRAGGRGVQIGEPRAGLPDPPEQPSACARAARACKDKGESATQARPARPRGLAACYVVLSVFFILSHVII